MPDFSHTDQKYGETVCPMQDLLVAIYFDNSYKHFNIAYEQQIE